MADLAAGSGLSIDQTIEADFWKVGCINTFFFLLNIKPKEQPYHEKFNPTVQVDFTSALELVRRRRVMVRRGYAYVPFEDLVVIVSGMLRANMTAAMAVIRVFQQHLLGHMS